MKSEQVHRVALQAAVTKPLRVCCCRETMSSIADSSHKLLRDAIYEYGMARSQNGPYDVQERRIIRKDGEQIVSEFLFIGIREDVRNSKSLKGINLTIVEEAAKVSQDSWDVLIPTVMGREEGSQLWAIWNPELTTDATWKMFMHKPPSNTIHIHTNYLENPWLTDTMRTVAQDCKEKDPKKYEHIWMGKPITEVEGAIYADELKQLDAEAANRITTVPIDRTRPVDTAWDLGFGDPTCIWFVQAYGGFWNLVDYYQYDGKDISHYAIMLQNKGYLYGTHWLPHDGIDNIIHKKLAGAGTDLSMSIPSLLAKAGLKVDVTPKLEKATTINALRTIFPVLRFDAVNCADGLQALRHYQWDKVADSNGEVKPGTRKPLHNWASHAPEGLQNMAVSVKQPGLGMMPKMPKNRRSTSEYGYMG